MATYEWHGPDVLVLGWIPFQLTGPYPWGWARRPGVKLLFLSGNPDPPPAFRDGAAFDAWIARTREYRVATMLRDVRVVFSDDAPPVFYADPQEDIGWTPLLRLPPVRRLEAAVARRPRLRRFLEHLPVYERGRSQPLVATPARVDPAGDWVEYHHRVGLKLTYWADLFCRYTTGRWAPFARVDVVYRVTRAGEVTVEVHSTAAPSQRLYVDWRSPAMGPSRSEHDMRRARRGRVTAFLESGKHECRPAPRSRRLWWRGPARSV